MLSGSLEPACRRRYWSIFLGICDAVSGHDPTHQLPGPVLISEPDAPRRQATAAVTRATIHPIANRVTTAGREPFLATTQTRVGTKGTPDWSSSIAVN
jgi:hypothetical protein